MDVKRRYMWWQVQMIIHNLFPELHCSQREGASLDRLGRHHDRWAFTINYYSLQLLLIMTGRLSLIGTQYFCHPVWSMNCDLIFKSVLGPDLRVLLLQETVWACTTRMVKLRGRRASMKGLPPSSWRRSWRHWWPQWWQVDGICVCKERRVEHSGRELLSPLEGTILKVVLNHHAFMSAQWSEVD